MEAVAIAIVMENMEEMDVMISYSGADCDFVKTLAGENK